MRVKIRTMVALSLLFSIQSPIRSVAEVQELSSSDVLRGVTITVAAGVGLGGTVYYYGNLIEASNQLHTRQSPVFSGTGEDLQTRRQFELRKLADLALDGTRRGDILTIDYIPGSAAEFRNAVRDLESAKSLWEKRVIELSKELGKLHRKVTVEKHALAKLPPSLEWQDARERTHERIDRLEREFRLVRNAELDAQSRMHHLRGLFEAERRNLEVSDRTGRVARSHIRMDFPIDEKSHGYLHGFVNRIAGPAEKLNEAEAGHLAKVNSPHVRITRIALPNLDRSFELLKQARRGAWAAGLGFVVAIEEVFAGKLSEGFRQGLEAGDVIRPRNSAATIEE
jgi:hypothetical protein